VGRCVVAVCCCDGCGFVLFGGGRVFVWWMCCKVGLFFLGDFDCVCGCVGRRWYLWWYFSLVVVFCFVK